MKTALWIVFLGLMGALALAARCCDQSQTFVNGEVYYFDGDCYARMTRARMVDAHLGLIVHEHRFENYPEGIRAHTTAPLDYAIVLLKRTLALTAPLWARLPGADVFREQTLDLAGALISPLFGVLTCLYLGWWARWGLQWPEGRRLAAAVPLFVAICPVLVEAGRLGRPDHQAPMVLTIAVALTAELSFLERPTRGWAIAAGVAWGASLWLSLYEPLVLLAATGLALLAFFFSSLRRRERWWELSLLGALVLGMLLIEGSPIPQLSPEVKAYFGSWSRSIGELQHLQPFSQPTLLHWLGLGAIAAPFALAWSGWRGERRGWVLAAFFLGTFAATCWQLRWGYFLGLVFAIALPWVLAVLRRPWLAWICLVVSLYPLAVEWEARLYPDEEDVARKAEELGGWVVLRQTAPQLCAREIRGAPNPSRFGMTLPTVEVRPNADGEFPFMAPWWLCAALAYWSGQPGAGGSAHEGLAGIVDSARVYATADRGVAGEILARRRIAYVLIDHPERTAVPAAAILGVELPPHSLGEDLFTRPHSAAPFLVLVGGNRYYKLFYFDPSKFSP